MAEEQIQKRRPKREDTAEVEAPATSGNAEKLKEDIDSARVVEPTVVP